MELTADKDNPAEQRLLEVFKEQASASLRARVSAGKKTIRGALAYLTDYAQKKYAKSNGGRAAVMDSDEIIGQFFHYLEEDSLDFEGKAPRAKVAATPNIARPAPAKPKKKEDPQMTFAELLFGKSVDFAPTPAAPAKDATPPDAHARALPARMEELAADYWDCECESGSSGFAHIHHKSEDRCQVCGARREDQPNSRASEVRAMMEGI